MVSVPDPEVTAANGVLLSMFLRCRPPTELYGLCS